MALKIIVDGFDVTNDLLDGTGMENYTYEVGKFYPSDGDTWLDLLEVINNNLTLKQTFFTPGIHKLQIVDTGNAVGTAKIWLKSKYTTRNR